MDAASGMRIAFQIADHTAETIWKAFATGWLRWAGSSRCLRFVPRSSQIARGFFDKAEGRGIFVERTLVEAHWQMGVIGIEGGNVWVSHRATAMKCAREQLRMASTAEREMR